MQEGVHGRTQGTRALIKPRRIRVQNLNTLALRLIRPRSQWALCVSCCASIGGVSVEAGAGACWANNTWCTARFKRVLLGVRSGSWPCDNALAGSERPDGCGGDMRWPQALIAATSGLMPMMFMTRVRL